MNTLLDVPDKYKSEKGATFSMLRSSSSFCLACRPWR